MENKTSLAGAAGDEWLFMKRCRSLYSYAKNILEDIGYKGYNTKIIFLLILTIVIRLPFDSDFKIVLLRIP